MAKRFWAIMIKRALLSIVVIFFAGIALDLLLNDRGERNLITSGLITIGLYLGAVLIVEILNLVSGTIYLWLFAERDFTAAVLDDLREAKLPAPRNCDPKNYSYLAALTDDESAPTPDRIRAAFLYGAYKNAMTSGLFRGLALHKAIDEAMLRYSQEAPQRAEAA